jgi:hypothetical protein
MIAALIEDRSNDLFHLSLWQSIAREDHGIGADAHFDHAPLPANVQRSPHSTG